MAATATFAPSRARPRARAGVPPSSRPSRRGRSSPRRRRPPGRWARVRADSPRLRRVRARVAGRAEHVPPDRVRARRAPSDRGRDAPARREAPRRGRGPLATRQAREGGARRNRLPGRGRRARALRPRARELGTPPERPQRDRPQSGRGGTRHRGAPRGPGPGRRARGGPSDDLTAPDDASGGSRRRLRFRRGLFRRRRGRAPRAHPRVPLRPPHRRRGRRVRGVARRHVRRPPRRDASSKKSPLLLERSARRSRDPPRVPVDGGGAPASWPTARPPPLIWNHQPRSDRDRLRRVRATPPRANGA